MLVLIVDDDMLGRQTLRRLIEKLGHEVIEAQNALHAKEVIDRTMKIEDREIHAAYIDWNLGQGLTGDYVANYLRGGTAKFMFTGYSAEVIRSRWKDPLEGFEKVIMKGSYDFEDIRADLERVERQTAITKP